MKPKKEKKNFEKNSNLFKNFISQTTSKYIIVSLHDCLKSASLSLESSSTAIHL
jgi:hypothetical protein